MDRRKSDLPTPRVDVDVDGELVILQSLSKTVLGLRSAVKLVGFLLFCAVVVMVALSIYTNRVENKVTKAEDAAKTAKEVAEETKDIVESTKELVEGAISELRSDDPEFSAKLQEAFDSIQRIEGKLNED